MLGRIKVISKKRKIVRFNSTQSTITVFFSLLMVVAMLIFLSIALNYTRNVTFENSVDLTLNITNQVNENIDSYIRNMENIASLITEGTELPFFLFAGDVSDQEMFAARGRVASQFITIKESRGDIANIAAVSKNGRFIVNDGWEPLSDFVHIEDKEWYQETLSSESGQVITSSHVQNVIPSSYEWVITLSRAMVNHQTNEREGVFFVDLNFEAISDLCNNYQLGSRGYIFILDDQGNIIYHPRQQLIHGGLLTENIDEIKSSTTPYIITERGREEIIYTISVSEKTGWSVIGVTFTSDLLANTYQTWLIYGLTTLILLIAVIVISWIISKEITKPIRKLKDSMELVEQGEFLKAGIEEIANNELGSLTNSFNVMTERIASLIEQNTIEQRERRKSEVRALQAQINPHFLYNTLDSIIWMSEANRNDEVVEMTSALAKLFRQAISNDKEEILIREEKEYVKNYLTIQQMRYKDKLDFSIEMDQEIENFKIIKFVLQPLVENAIYHGLKYREGKGHLVLKGYLDKSVVCIEVRDNGVGMSEDRLSTIFDEKEIDFKRNGVGINNVQRRLKLFYGEAYGLRFKSELNQGTTVTVTIPIGERGSCA